MGQTEDKKGEVSNKIQRKYGRKKIKRNSADMF